MRGGCLGALVFVLALGGCTLVNATAVEFGDLDGSVLTDAEVDAGADANRLDAASPDSGSDASALDAAVDAGPLDAGPDTGLDDAGEPDAGCTATDTLEHCGACFRSCSWQCVEGECNDAVQLDAGEVHTCVVLQDATVACWGSNAAGELGDGTTIARSRPVATQPLGMPVQSVVVGTGFTCALMANGTIQCWGRNSVGQLGDGTTTGRTEPAAVQNLPAPAVQVVAGSSHACARLETGALRCWGGNSSGQLGEASNSMRTLPVTVSGLGTGSAVTDLDAGSGHTCAVVSGQVRCWGNNSRGQLGDGTRTSRNTPLEIPGLSSVEAVAVGGAHTCIQQLTGAVQCWGRGSFGEIGVDDFSDFDSPQLVSSIATATWVDAGSTFTCASADGATRCWGDNRRGQLGDGTTTDRAVPTPVVGIAAVDAVSLGRDHTCALVSGLPVCWGANSIGLLGDGTTFPREGVVEVLALP